MITYKTNCSITAAQYIELLKYTTLGERRPIDDHKRIELMLKHTNLLVTAWKDNELIGLARSVTDFNYCCYLSDLAIRENYQRQGIGKMLIAHTKDSLNANTTIILLSAPQAVDYYPHIQFTPHPSAWTTIVSN